MLCNKCGAYIGDTAAPLPVYCHKCDDHLYDKAAAIGIYEKALSASIVNLKTVPMIPLEKYLERLPAALQYGNFYDYDLIDPNTTVPQKKS